MQLISFNGSKKGYLTWSFLFEEFQNVIGLNQKKCLKGHWFCLSGPKILFKPFYFFGLKCNEYVKY
jgi:hypothetical protein